MRLWTIQHEKAFETLEKSGVLTANENNLFCEDYYRFAYDWLVEQMKLRVGMPPYGIHYPIWAWYQWEGKRKRCDLRCGGYAQRGTHLVQLEMEIPDNEVMLSDFDDWHCVLNRGLNSDDEAELDEYYNSIRDIDNEEFWNNIEKYPDLVHLREKVIQSWDRIFDMDNIRNDASIQATFWLLKKEQVVKEEHFIAK